MNKGSPLHFFSAALLSALLLTLSWQPYGIAILAFAGFVPLLWLAHQLRDKKLGAVKMFFYAWLSFAIWNVATTWWVWNSSIEGALMAFILNSLLMCLPVLFYFRLLGKMDRYRADLSFVFLWIAFEYGHHNWEGSWPWLTLGNLFSSIPSWVQWYEYTGCFGGTFWVLLVNVQLLRYIEKWADRSVRMRYSNGLNLVFFYVFAPIFLSYYIGSSVKVNGRNLNVMVVQPNIDPYSEKFDGMTPVEQTRKMLRIAEKACDSSVQLVCFPETALQGGLEESHLEADPGVLLMRQFLLAHPQVSILTGADSYRFYNAGEQLSPTARKFREAEAYYDAYNTALMLNNGEPIEVYHKAKLVPGVERLPYAQYMGFIKKLTIDLGGTSGSLGSDSTSKVFHVGWMEENKRIAPVICYESIYGEYVASYVKKGAGIITIITNDGWWGNTPGYKQHFDYARLRAIETRRYIARSANTGISGFIDPSGNVLQRSEWWKEDALKATVVLNTDETFYVKFGDYIGMIAVLFSALNIFRSFRRKQPVK